MSSVHALSFPRSEFSVRQLREWSEEVASMHPWAIGLFLAPGAYERKPYSSSFGLIHFSMLPTANGP